MAENRIVDVTDRALVRQLLEQNSARISYGEMKNATSEAWKTFVLVNVDNRFATFVKCIDCCNILSWKHLTTFLETIIIDIYGLLLYLSKVITSLNLLQCNVCVGEGRVRV